jgi:hypothetical protein
VGRFIGRLGIVPMPAIERGLALRSPVPFSLQTLHTLRVAWAVADIERAGHRWHAARELARTPRRWGAEVANERGGRSRRLPDLVFWPALDETMPVAVVVVHGPPKPRRERAAPEGWKGSIAAGRYAQVRYLARPAAARRLERMATQIGLTATQFIAGDRVVTGEPPAPAPADVIEKLAEAPAPAEPAPLAVSSSPRPSPAHITPRPASQEQPVETPEQAAERQKLIRELLGEDEPAPRRRWRRRST